MFRAIEAFEPGMTVKVKANRPEIENDADGSPQLVLKELIFEVKLIASDDSMLLLKN